MKISNKNKSRYALYKEKAKMDSAKYSNALTSEGSYNYFSQVTQLRILSQNLNLKVLRYLFGDVIGAELFEQYVTKCNKDLLFFFAAIDEDYGFFILYELKSNKELFYNY